MTKRTRNTLIALTLALLPVVAEAAPSAAPRATTVPKAIVAAGPIPSLGARELYSPRARRLVRNYLQLQLLELRAAELQRVRAVIEGRLSVEALFSPEPSQAGRRATAR